jgi:hypothetical protein
MTKTKTLHAVSDGKVLRPEEARLIWSQTFVIL